MRTALYYVGLGLTLTVVTPLLMVAAVLGSGGYWEKLAAHYRAAIQSWRQITGGPGRRGSAARQPETGDNNDITRPEPPNASRRDDHD